MSITLSRMFHLLLLTSVGDVMSLESGVSWESSADKETSRADDDDTREEYHMYG